MNLIKSDIRSDLYSIKKTFVLEKIYYDIQNLIDMLDISNDLYHFLHNPFLKTQKQWLFLYIISHLETITSTIIKFIPFITVTDWKEKKGVPYRFMNLWNRQKQLVKINVITALPFTNTIEEYLLKLGKTSHQNRKFFLEKKVNNCLIGGLILRFEDKEWDNSLEDSYLNLRTHFTNPI